MANQKERRAAPRSTAPRNEAEAEVRHRSVRDAVTPDKK